MEREKIRFVMFYTPQMQVFTMTESFKKANFKNLINMTCGGASLSKVTRIVIAIVIGLVDFIATHCRTYQE